MISLRLSIFFLLLYITFAIKPNLLPYPRSITYGSSSILTDPCKIYYNIQGQNTQLNHIYSIIDFFYQKTFPTLLCVNVNRMRTKSLSDDEINLEVLISDLRYDYPSQNTNESYTLIINQTNHWHIKSENYYGFLRGLETLVQLIEQDIDNETLYRINKYPIIISDAPSFNYRGIMIDTSRHFLQISTLKRILDAMLFNKLNVLHWHIVDEESFPMQLESFPLITSYGAYSKDNVYSVSDIKDLIEYAKTRGVRIIPEVDSPAHTMSWGVSPMFSNITMRCEMYSGQLDPTMNETYKVVKGVLDDVVKYFPDEFIHLGGDEVNASCWENKPWIKKFMKEQGFASSMDLQNYYKLKEKKMLNSKRKAVYWLYNENFTMLDGEIIQYWGNIKGYSAIAHLKNSVILSPYDKLYLDVGYGNSFGDQSWSSFSSWKDIYNFNPYPKEIKEDRILGAEVCLWSELNNDETTENKLWIRSSAFAERMWNGRINSGNVDIVKRLYANEERMRKRGFKISPVSSEYCSRNVEVCFSD